MRRQWIVLLIVLLVAIVTATGTSIYILQSDLTTLSGEMTALLERVAALEAKQPTSAIGGEPSLSPHVRLAPGPGARVSDDLARQLALDGEQQREVNRLIDEFFAAEAAHLAATTRTATGQVEMSIRTDEGYRRARQERWQRFLTREIAPKLSPAQVAGLRDRLSPGSPVTSETIQVFW